MRLFRPFETTLIVSTMIFALLMLEVRDRNYYTTVVVSIWLIGAGIASWNDVLDKEIDEISHPDRPIPSGQIVVKLAKILGSVLIALGLLGVYLLGIKIFLVSAIIVIIGVSYSITTKRMLLMKNSTVTFTGIMTLTSLLWIFDKPMTGLYFGLILSISLLLFSYEILKDIQDIEGDKKVGIETIANKLSPTYAGIISVGLFMMSCLVMAINFAIHNLYIESVISLITTILITVPALYLVRDPSARNSEITRYTIIFIIFSSLFVISILQMKRMDYYILF